MCPLCFATMGYVAAGAVSTGGLAAMVVKISRRKRARNENIANVNGRRISDVSQHDRQPENRFAS